MKFMQDEVNDCVRKIAEEKKKSHVKWTPQARYAQTLKNGPEATFPAETTTEQYSSGKS